MAQVPERCMQMLKQIITEIENRQNITRDQLALLLETTDTGDIAFLHERARKTADAIYGKQVWHSKEQSQGRTLSPDGGRNSFLLCKWV